MSRRLRIPREVVSEVLDGEAVVLDLSKGTYFGLNRSATRIWQLLQKHGSIRAVRDVFLSEYEVDPAIFDADLEAVLDELERRGLVAIDESEARK